MSTVAVAVADGRTVILIAIVLALSWATLITILMMIITMSRYLSALKHGGFLRHHRGESLPGPGPFGRVTRGLFQPLPSILTGLILVSFREHVESENGHWQTIGIVSYITFISLPYVIRLLLRGQHALFGSESDSKSLHPHLGMVIPTHLS